VIFDYAYDNVDTIRIFIDKNLEVDALPDPVYVSNQVGIIDWSVTKMGNTLLVAARSLLRQPIFSDNFYDQVKEFSNEIRKMEGLSLVLKKTAPKPIPVKLKNTTKKK